MIDAWDIKHVNRLGVSDHDREIRPEHYWWRNSSSDKKIQVIGMKSAIYMAIPLRFQLGASKKDYKKRTLYCNINIPALVTYHHQ
jgi:hypothetical protein